MKKKKIKIAKLVNFKGNRQSPPYLTEYELRWVDMGTFESLERPTKKELLQIAVQITNWVRNNNVIRLEREEK